MQIQLDALDRSFEPGCHNWVDVTARELGVPNSADRVTLGIGNMVWSCDFAAYLLSGDAVMAIRSFVGVDGTTRRLIDRSPVIASRSGYTVHRVPHPLRPPIC
jgi:hypothetical protein